MGGIPKTIIDQSVPVVWQSVTRVDALTGKIAVVLQPASSPRSIILLMDHTDAEHMAQAISTFVSEHTNGDAWDAFVIQPASSPRDMLLMDHTADDLQTLETL